MSFSAPGRQTPTDRRSKLRQPILAATFCATALLMASLTRAADDAPDGWLQGAHDDVQRFERLERYLGGFSRSMWEVGERYARLHEALQGGNYALARYHWEKIGATIRAGYLKRPARQPNADAQFLDRVWPAVDEELASADSTRAWAGFESARAACMACHVAEGVPFMNDQAMFQTLLPPARE
jgi:hypothetical protein